MKRTKLFLPAILALGFGLVLSGCVNIETPTEYVTVTFDYNSPDPGPAIAQKVIVKGEKVTRPTNPTRGNFTFGDWYSGLDAASALFDFNAPVEADITVFAKWNAVVVYHDVTFYANYAGGSNKTIQVADGALITRPADPVRYYSEFVDWFATANYGGIIFDFTQPVRGTTHIYARWNALKPATNWSNEAQLLMTQTFGEVLPYFELGNFYQVGSAVSQGTTFVVIESVPGNPSTLSLSALHNFFSGLAGWTEFVDSSFEFDLSFEKAAVLDPNIKTLSVDIYYDHVSHEYHIEAYLFNTAYYWAFFE